LLVVILISTYLTTLEKVVYVGDDGQNREFGEGPNVLLIARGTISILEQVRCKQPPHGKTCAIDFPAKW
jgi:hypothetical protein